MCVCFDDYVGLWLCVCLCVCVSVCLCVGGLCVFVVCVRAARVCLLSVFTVFRVCFGLC